MCQSEQKDLYSTIINGGLPLESSVPILLSRHGSPDAMEGLEKMLKPRPPPIPPQINRPCQTDLRKRDMMDLLHWSYFAVRCIRNPTYYGLPVSVAAPSPSIPYEEGISSGGEYGTMGSSRAIDASTLNEAAPAARAAALEKAVSEMVDKWWMGRVGEFGEVPDSLSYAGSRHGSTKARSTQGFGSTGANSTVADSPAPSSVVGEQSSGHSEGT